MAKVEVKRVKNPGSGFGYTFSGEGLQAHADFDPLTRVAEVKFDQATNMAEALQAVVDTLQNEARLWKTNPVIPLRIDIDAGRFANSLRQVAPRFGFSNQQPAGEFATEDQHVRFRAELPLAG